MSIPRLLTYTTLRRLDDDSALVVLGARQTGKTTRIIGSRYLKDGAQHYFWRTNRGQEIDLIELNNGQLNAFEIK